MVAAWADCGRNTELGGHPPCTAGRLRGDGRRDAAAPPGHGGGVADLADRSGCWRGIAGLPA